MGMNDIDRLNNTISDVAYILDSLRDLKQIYQSGCCNSCTNRECGYLPKPGQLVRYNCPFYKTLFPSAAERRTEE